MLLRKFAVLSVAVEERNANWPLRGRNSKRPRELTLQLRKFGEEFLVGFQVKGSLNDKWTDLSRVDPSRLKPVTTGEDAGQRQEHRDGCSEHHIEISNDQSHCATDC